MSVLKNILEAFQDEKIVNEHLILGCPFESLFYKVSIASSSNVFFKEHLSPQRQIFPFFCAIAN